MFKNHVNRTVIEQNLLHFFIYTTSGGEGGTRYLIKLE